MILTPAIGDFKVLLKSTTGVHSLANINRRSLALDVLD
jgi:hypothetical protein